MIPDSEEWINANEFRITNLSKDISLGLIIITISAFLVFFFIIIDLIFIEIKTKLIITVISRGVCIATLISAIFILRKTSKPMLFDRIVILNLIVTITHMLIVSSLSIF